MKIPAAEIKNTPFAAVRFTFVQVTPELAADWLMANHRNRKLREDAVNGYVLDMKNGAWMTTHQGIAFDDADNLIDGQHRLQALVRAKSPVLMLVSSGWPAEKEKRKTMDAVDRGRARTLADQLHLQHDVPKKQAGEVVKICNALAAAAFGLSRVSKSTTDTILAVFALYKPEINWWLANPITQTGVRQTTVAACLIMARAHWEDKTADALGRLQTGENLTRENPLLHLRNWLTSDGSREENALVRQVTFHHLAAFVDGKALPQIVVNSNAAYIRVCKIHKVRIEKICAIYGQPLPVILAEKTDEVKKPVAAGPFSETALKIGESLSDLFSSTDLMARTEENASQWLLPWLRKKWIESAGVRQYRKTAEFGKI